MPMTKEEREAQDALALQDKREYEEQRKWKDDRLAEYGSVEEQLEYLAENGIKAFTKRQADIKAKYPKPS